MVLRPEKKTILLELEKNGQKGTIAGVENGWGLEAKGGPPQFCTPRKKQIQKKYLRKKTNEANVYLRTEPHPGSERCRSGILRGMSQGLLEDSGVDNRWALEDGGGSGIDDWRLATKCEGDWSAPPKNITPPKKISHFVKVEHRIAKKSRKHRIWVLSASMSNPFGASGPEVFLLTSRDPEIRPAPRQQKNLYLSTGDIFFSQNDFGYSFKN